MRMPLSFAGSLLLSTALVAPSSAWAQSTDAGAGVSPTQDSQPSPDAGEEDVEISGPGAGGQEIVVRGRFIPNTLRANTEVVSVLSSADIARTGEGDIAGALERVTGLSVVGNGFVYVRGLGDRYSLALLNGSPLPSPEPLKRVVPLDIFPTSVIASSVVQKTFSASYPGEFGGGAINLTTIATPSEPFFNLSFSVGGDTETTGNLGYTYFGSRTDWTGFDDGTRDIPPLLNAALNSGRPILPGADFSLDELKAIQLELVNAPTTVLQRNDNIPVNWSAGFSGGTTIPFGDSELGLIASANISNKWLTRQTLQQTASTLDLSGTPASDFTRVITDNRIVVSGLLGAALEFGEHKLRWTNLYIRDTLKQARLGIGTNINTFQTELLEQDTAWFERQLINSQLVGEFKFDALSVNARGGYANSQREAPYERGFTYVRSTVDDPNNPLGRKFINDLGGSSQGAASLAFSDLNEDLWFGAVDLAYELTPDITASVGYAYSDASRSSVRRAFLYRAPGIPTTVQQLRPDFLLSDASIQLYDIFLIETSAQDGTAAFQADLTTNAGYFQLQINMAEGLNLNAGVRYEDAKQTVVPVDLFSSGASAIVPTNINNDYFLPTATLTWEFLPDMQLRFNVSSTIARPQFRELIAQVFQDTDSNRIFRGNPSLQDSRLINAEARYEWYFDRDQRLSAAAFYKSIDNPIETFTSNSDNLVNSSFANAPKATLYGAEIEAVKYFDMSNWVDGSFFASRRLLLLANYTYTQSELKVGPNDVTVVNGLSSDASNFFIDGAPLTGQSDHLVNLQIGLEDTERLSQQTLLLIYNSDRVTSRGPSGQPDIFERPGLRLDFVVRQGIRLAGVDAELKFEARNITRTKYQELQEVGDNRIFYNRYDLGASYSIGLTANF
ncbi:TonB-dependent receptor domain-containing protein [Blastomonas aquatica]|nr:TonB-dependent receptor [Blastomonas aquatica]